MAPLEQHKPRSIGRYVLFREVAHGGMATVHIGRLRGPAGFARTVAIKRLHAPFARDPEFVSMFLDEARLAARIQHPNVVSVLDVVAADGELFLVMDYVLGESLSHLLKLARKQSIAVPRRIFVTIMAGVLTGLHAAHEARNESGDALEIVHRDVSPQNVLLGLDGVPRVLDFGVAKASLRVHWSTQTGQLKGKLGYMSPEQLTTGLVDRRADIYACGVMLWEGLTGRRLFDTKDVMDAGALVLRVINGEVDPPSKIVPSTPKALDAIVLKALSRSREQRYATAYEMAVALERIIPPATTRQITDWVVLVAGPALRERATDLAQVERTALPPPQPSSDAGFHALKAAGELAGSNDDEDSDSLVSVLAPKARVILNGAVRGSVGSDQHLAGLLPTREPSRELLEETAEEVVLSQSDEIALSPAASVLPDRSPWPEAPVPALPSTAPPPPMPAAAGRAPPIPAVPVNAAPVTSFVAPLLPRSWLAVATLSGLLAVTFWFVRPAARSVASAATTAAPVAATPPPLPPLAPEKDTAETVTPRSADDPLPEPPASGRAVTAAPGSATASKRHASKVPKSNCDPPFTLDAQGVRIPKRECFR